MTPAGSELTALWSGAEQEEQEDEHRRRQPTADSGTAASHDLAESAPLVRPVMISTSRLAPVVASGSALVGEVVLVIAARGLDNKDGLWIGHGYIPKKEMGKRREVDPCRKE
jgi:hypothetical protein